MSKIHPVIAVTGSSGAGTSTVKTAFEHIFHKPNVGGIEGQRRPVRRWWKRQGPVIAATTDDRAWALSGEPPTPKAAFTRLSSRVTARLSETSFRQTRSRSRRSVSIFLGCIVRRATKTQH